MIVKKIYLDMDGVLADFNRGMQELLGLEPFDQGSGWHPEKDDELWERVKKYGHFYDALELIPGSKEFFDAVYGRFYDRCEILTGIPKPRRGITSAGEDKIKWVRRLLSENVVIHVVQREEKPGYCTGKDCILIDDYQKNIKEWEKSGGTGILFTDAEDILGRLSEMDLE